MNIKNRIKQGESILNKLEPRNQSEELWGKANVCIYNVCASRCCFDKFQHEIAMPRVPIFRLTAHS